MVTSPSHSLWKPQKKISSTSVYTIYSHHMYIIQLQVLDPTQSISLHGFTRIPLTALPGAKIFQESCEMYATGALNLGKLPPTFLHWPEFNIRSTCIPFWKPNLASTCQMSLSSLLPLNYVLSYVVRTQFSTDATWTAIYFISHIFRKQAQRILFYRFPCLRGGSRVKSWCLGLKRAPWPCTKRSRTLLFLPPPESFHTDDIAPLIQALHMCCHFERIVDAFSIHSFAPITTSIYVGQPPSCSRWQDLWTAISLKLIRNSYYFSTLKTKLGMCSGALCAGLPFLVYGITTWKWTVTT